MTVASLALLLRWMAEMPAAFRAEPEGFAKGGVRVRAVVADLFETLLGAPLPAATLAAFDPADSGKPERNRLRWILAATHLLWHPTFRERTLSRASLEKLLVQDLATLSGVVNAEQLDREEERREELIRRTLRALDLLLPGETRNESDDRLKQVDSVERRRILAEAATRERRAREVREAMAKKAAQEAAAKVSRE